MPTYTYSCFRCGSFSLLRPMAESDLPASCPACSRASRRVFDSPHLSGLSSALDRAVARADSSAEAPPVTTRIPPAARGWR